MQLLAWCDKYWGPLEFCQVPGAFKMRLPFVAPMDHVLGEGGSCQGAIHTLSHTQAACSCRTVPRTHCSCSASRCTSRQHIDTPSTCTPPHAPHPPHPMLHLQSPSISTTTLAPPRLFPFASTPFSKTSARRRRSR